jgi:AAA domain
MNHGPPNERYFAEERLRGSVLRPDLRPVPPAEIHSAPKEIDRAESNPAGEEGSLALPFAPIALVLAKVPAEPEWLWRGYLAPGSVTLLAGRPKVGKSTLLFALLDAVDEGRPLLGLDVRKVGAVLLSEERQGTLKSKAEAFELGHVDLLMRHDANGTLWPDVVREAVTRCHTHKRGLLVVDTLPAWTGLGGDLENASGAVIQAVAPLQDAAATGLGVLALAHQRKSFGEHGEAVRGSNALLGAVDVLVELERPRSGVGDDPRRRVLRSLSRYPSTPAELVIALTDDGYKALGDEAAVHEATERQQLLEAIGDDALSAHELYEVTGIPEATVRKRLDGAPGVEVRGRGVKGDPRRYSIPHNKSLRCGIEPAEDDELERMRRKLGDEGSAA